MVVGHFLLSPANAAVCTALLEEFCDRGLDTSQPTLLVLDGAKTVRRVPETFQKAGLATDSSQKRRKRPPSFPYWHWDDHHEQRKLWPGGSVCIGMVAIPLRLVMLG